MLKNIFFLLFLHLFLLWGMAQEQMKKKIQVVVTVPPQPEEFIKVSMKGPFGKAKGKMLYMAPAVVGAYSRFDFYPFIHQLHAYNKEGKPLVVTKQNNGYRIESSGTLHSISYKVDAAKTEKAFYDLLVSSHRRPNYTLLSGYATFLLVKETFEFPHYITLKLPKKWKAVWALPATDDAYMAQNAFELIDEPLMLGTNIHSIKIPGAFPSWLHIYAESQDISSFVATLKTAQKSAISAISALNFPILPYSYHVFFEVFTPKKERKLGWALEHGRSFHGAESSKRINNYGLRLPYHIVHHILHSWIPRKFYTNCLQPQRQLHGGSTEFIWFAEGFVQYLAFVALAKANIASCEEVLKLMAKRFVPTYLYHGPSQSRSMAQHSLVLSRGEHQHWRYGYAAGGLLALWLDQKLHKSKSGKSLSKVMRELYIEYSHRENGLLNSKFAQVFAQKSRPDFYDILIKCVWNKQPLPVDKILKGVGVKRKNKEFVVVPYKELSTTVQNFRQNAFNDK